ncbi:hypothetical protein Pelo_18997 [Pelomyxa schiedti]|nr:hypothetical protein Pelo_18997 [Pelomyxa schiedti]
MGPSAVLLLWVAAVATVGCFVVEPGDGVVTVFYSSTSWSQVYIHYDCGLTGVWTTSPGVAMSVSTNTSYLYPPWWVAYLPCNGLEFVFNNGAGTWDNNGGSNYKATLPGIYTVASGTLTTIQTFSKAAEVMLLATSTALVMPLGIAFVTKDILPATTGKNASMMLVKIPITVVRVDQMYTHLP